MKHFPVKYKYIDAEKLIAEIERRMKCYDREGCEPNDGKWVELVTMKHFIESLQQEQPQVADASKMEQPEANLELDAEIDKFLYGTKFKRDCDGVHVPGVCMRDWKGKKYINRDVTPDDMRKFASYFIEIGKNARKGE